MSDVFNKLKFKEPEIDWVIRGNEHVSGVHMLARLILMEIPSHNDVM